MSVCEVNGQHNQDLGQEALKTQIFTLGETSECERQKLVFNVRFHL